MKLVFICSTNGSVIRESINTGFLDEYDIEIVSDRSCGVIEYAISDNIKYTILKSSTGAEFSEKIYKEYSNESDVLFISFYTKILTSPLVRAHSTRLINFHPSILPACPGMDGFGDTIRSGAKFVGSTVHLIDLGIDTGLPILQAAYPNNVDCEIKLLRHRVFLQQVISLIQVCAWYNEGRIQKDKKGIFVSNAVYDISEFSPNLDIELKEYYEKILLNKAGL